MCLGGFLHLKSTAECQMSTLIFGGGGLYKHPVYNSKRQSFFLAHLEFKSKVLPGPFADLNAWVGFCTSCPRQGVKFQLRYWGMAPIKNSCKIRNGKVLAHLEFKSKILLRLLTDISAWVGFWTSSPQQGVRQSSCPLGV